jgi:hypothetical protein
MIRGTSRPGSNNGRAGTLAGPDTARQRLRAGEGAGTPCTRGGTFRATPTPRRLRTAALLLALLLASSLATGCRERAAQPAQPQAGPVAATPLPVRVYLFFPADDTLLHREARMLPELPDATTSRIRAVLEELLTGSQEGLAPAFPWAASVEAVFVDRAGNAYVDLSPPPADALQGTSSEVMLVYAVINTVVANCKGIERVQLLFGGREVATLGNLDLSQPLAPRPQLVAP